jgi:hypothetical protein
MDTKSCIMALLTAASFAIQGVEADRRCAIVGPGVAYCRQHPKSTAAVVKQLNIGDVYNYACRWPFGETVNGDRYSTCLCSFPLGALKAFSISSPIDFLFLN